MTGTGTDYQMDRFLLDLVSNNVKADDKILSYLSITNVVKLGKVLKRLDRVRNLDCKALATTTKRKKKKKQLEGQQSRLVGMLLEQAIGVLLEGCKSVLEYDGNVRTTTSEIDFMMKITTLSNVVPMLNNVGTHVLGEAKCYSSGMKSEWLNELVGMMGIHGTSHSILFVASPSKNLLPAHRFTLQSHAVMGKHIVPFGMAQVKQVLAGANFLKVLGNQFVAMRSGSNSLAI